MLIRDHLRIQIYEKMWREFKVGLNVSESIITALNEEGGFDIQVNSPEDIRPFFDKVLKHYLFPNNLNRAKVYDQEFLKQNQIRLRPVARVEDEWCYNLYFDEKNQMYWQDNMVVNTPLGFKISPYRNPLNRLKVIQ